MTFIGFLIVACKRIYHYSVARMNHYLTTKIFCQMPNRLFEVGEKLFCCLISCFCLPGWEWSVPAVPGHVLHPRRRVHARVRKRVPRTSGNTRPGQALFYRVSFQMGSKWAHWDISQLVGSSQLYHWGTWSLNWQETRVWSLRIDAFYWEVQNEAATC